MLLLLHLLLLTFAAAFPQGKPNEAIDISVVPKGLAVRGAAGDTSVGGFSELSRRATPKAVAANGAVDTSQAQTLGIDPRGPMPNDYISDNGRSISFKAGSKFAAWAAAQAADTTGLELSVMYTYPPSSSHCYFPALKEVCA
jgi:hypothetical protein